MDTATTTSSKYPAFVVPRNRFATARVLPLLMLLAALAWPVQAQNAKLSTLGSDPGGENEIQDFINCTCQGDFKSMVLRYEGADSQVDVKIDGTTYADINVGDHLSVTPMGSSVTVEVDADEDGNFESSQVVATSCNTQGTDPIATESGLNRDFSIGGNTFRMTSITGDDAFPPGDLTCDLKNDAICNSSVAPLIQVNNTTPKADPEDDDTNDEVTFTAPFKNEASTSGGTSAEKISEMKVTVKYSEIKWDLFGTPSGGDSHTTSSGTIVYTITDLNPGATETLIWGLKVDPTASGSDDVSVVVTSMTYDEDDDSSPGAAGSITPEDDECVRNFTVLPVELVSFDAVLDGRSALLEWATASETNNAGFEVQHRYADANNKFESEFEALGWVEGAGTTLERQSYSYRIEDLDPGRHVFRLKQLDFDGTFEYSPQIEVAIEMPEAFLVSRVYPNPFNPEASFSFGVKQSQQVSVELFNMLGQRVRELYQGTPAAGVTQTIQIDGSGLQSGLYLLRVLGERFVDTQTITLIK